MCCVCPFSFPPVRKLNGMNWNERNVLNEKRREEEQEREGGRDEKCFCFALFFEEKKDKYP